jgi:hypothetical protein
MLRFSLLAIAALIGLSTLQDGAYGQGISYSVGRYRYIEDPAVNNYLSARYDYLLQTNLGFRHYRMWKECHTINFIPLHDHCIGTFDEYEPIIWAR